MWVNALCPRPGNACLSAGKSSDCRWIAPKGMGAVSWVFLSVSLDFWMKMPVLCLDFWMNLAVLCLDFWIKVVILP